MFWWAGYLRGDDTAGQAKADSVAATEDAMWSDATYGSEACGMSSINEVVSGQ